MNKISEKAVWDELVPSADEKTSSASFIQSAQPQMMFCYKCNQVIPANSAFCPWCQTELFVTCPKCGNKYSSQYPSCNQCGTNRENYIIEQQKEKARMLEEESQREIIRQKELEEQRRKEEKEAERRRLEEKINAYRKETERQERIAAEKARLEEERKRRERNNSLNAKIRKTDEYISVLSVMNKAYGLYRTKHKLYYVIFLIIFMILCIPFVFVAFEIDWYEDWLFNNIPDALFSLAFYAPIVIVILYAFGGSVFLGVIDNPVKCARFIDNYIHSQKITDNQKMYDYLVKKISSYSGPIKKLPTKFGDWIIEAYRDIMRVYI